MRILNLTCWAASESQIQNGLYDIPFDQARLEVSSLLRFDRQPTRPEIQSRCCRLSEIAKSTVDSLQSFDGDWLVAIDGVLVDVPLWMIQPIESALAHQSLRVVYEYKPGGWIFGNNV